MCHFNIQNRKNEKTVTCRIAHYSRIPSHPLFGTGRCDIRLVLLQFVPKNETFCFILCQCCFTDFSIVKQAARHAFWSGWRWASCPGDRSLALTLRISGNVTQAFVAGQSAHQHGQILTPAVVCAKFDPDVACGQLVRFMSVAVCSN